MITSIEETIKNEIVITEFKISTKYGIDYYIDMCSGQDGDIIKIDLHDPEIKNLKDLDTLIEVLIQLRVSLRN